MEVLSALQIENETNDMELNVNHMRRYALGVDTALLI